MLWKKAAATLLLIVIVFSSILCGPKTLANSAALFAFGDSTTDVGNNNFLPGAPKANFPPYGVDYPGGTPTGRFTNGFNGVDYIAQGMGLSMSPPQFLSVSSIMQMMRGVNFASAGSGILDSTGQGVISMGAQVRDFERVSMELAARMGNQSAAALLAQAVFFFRVGGNDLFLQSSLGRPKDQIVTLLINQFRNQLKTLHEFGARKFAVMGTGLVGCIPARRSSNPSGECDEDLNDLSFRFKTATRALLEGLSVSLQGFQYSFGDSYETTARIYANPLAFGFTEVKAACCGGGRFNAESGCTPSAAYCSDRGQHFFWDAVHPTQAAYKLQVEVSFGGTPLFADLMNIQQSEN